MSRITTEEYMALEVSWYKKNGMFKDRININRDGRAYVIGDYSWNKNNSRRQEVIEPEMKLAIERFHPATEKSA